MAQECGSRGFTAVKMNATEEMQFVDSHAKVDAVLERVQAIRDAMGPHFGIGVDFHGRVHRPMAKVIAKELEPYKLMFIEEPVLSEHAEALKEIANHCSTPIALGERLFSRWDFKKHPRGRVRRHHPARSLARGRHHRNQEDRRDGRSVRRRARAALSAGTRSRSRPTSSSTRSATTRSSRSSRSASTTTRRTTCSTTWRIHRCSRTTRATSRSRRVRGSGSRSTRRSSCAWRETGHRWRNPVWRHADGSFAEW